MDVLEAMEADSGIRIAELRVDGGATVNNFLMQFQSDVLGCAVVRPQTTETTALGAAYLAGLAVGYWEHIDAIKGQWKAERCFEPSLTAVEMASMRQGWKQAIKGTIAMVK
jgi:glycerol kinase